MQSKNGARGFTLIEVMIVVAVIAILAAIALPSYAEYVKRARRADAKAGLQAAATWLERVSTSTGTYPASLPTELSSLDYYSVTLGSGDGGYELTAAPKGAQAGDKCGSFTLDGTGAQGVSGTTMTANECWNK